jgi:hypothetical protein
MDVLSRVKTMEVEKCQRKDVPIAEVEWVR